MLHVTYKSAMSIVWNFCSLNMPVKKFGWFHIKKSRTEGSVCPVQRIQGLTAILCYAQRDAKVTYHQHATIWSKCDMSGTVVGNMVMAQMRLAVVGNFEVRPLQMSGHRPWRVDVLRHHLLCDLFQCILAYLGHGRESVCQRGQLGRYHICVNVRRLQNVIHISLKTAAQKYLRLLQC